MIDHDIIEKSVEYSKISLENREVTLSRGLYFLKDFLNPNLSSRVLEFLDNDDIVWTKEENQYDLNREKINWIFDSPIEELHITMDSLTDYINKIFNRNNKFLGITIWKDSAGYTISKHTDNPLIDVAMQIYLTAKSDIDAGTSFIINDTIVKVPYKQNFGYLMDNTLNIEHFMDGKIPDEYIRYSLYAMWSTNIK